MNYYNEIKNELVNNEINRKVKNYDSNKQSKLTENDMLDFLYEDIYSIKRELLTLLSVENR